MSDAKSLPQEMEKAFNGDEQVIDNIAIWMGEKIWKEEFDKADLVFELLSNQFFDQCLDQMDVPLTFLMASNSASSELPERSEFLTRFREEVSEEGLFLEGFE